MTYHLSPAGIYQPSTPVTHRDDEYDQTGFDTLWAAQSWEPGGQIFVATPAFRQFWSYIDDLAHHLRRYTRGDFKTIADRTGGNPPSG